MFVAALLLYWVPAARLDDADLDRTGGLGLISVLPLPTLVGAALLYFDQAARVRYSPDEQPVPRG